MREDRRHFASLFNSIATSAIQEPGASIRKRLARNDLLLFHPGGCERDPKAHYTIASNIQLRWHPARRAKHPVNPSTQKHSYLPNFGYVVSMAHPARHKGRFAIVTRRGPGGGGRDGVGALGRLQGGNPREQLHARYDTALTASLVRPRW
ncbi:hypothetical protein ABIA00_008255 [Bradyrhizobium ottawaense]|uniref:hypothetical protein n=1 Tax=Bradyrhizobium TaxID=374 RepID=UPI0012602D98|nr:MULTISPECIES: hypothetical protein [Bradyrhizobium]MBR1326270.1 hypothetical protein [Bradyrhizobium ottawaense]MBR1332034.1 hypothetical protein [Bradyrhizobium ottawaense]